MIEEETDDFVGNVLHGRSCGELDFGEHGGQRTALLATYRDINVTEGHIVSHLVSGMVDNAVL